MGVCVALRKLTVLYHKNLLRNDFPKNITDKGLAIPEDHIGSLRFGSLEKRIKLCHSDGHRNKS